MALGRNKDHDAERGSVRSDETTVAHGTPTTTGSTSADMRDDTRGDRRDTRTDEVDLRDRERRGAMMTDPREDIDRQHDAFGGFKSGAAFFGWLSANGLTVILVALASAAGVALGLTENADTSDATSNAETVGLVGGIVLLVILALGYFAGGYVAGRMSRFDGARQGFGVWLIGLIVVAALAIAGAVAGAEYNVLSELNLPRIPVDEGEATTAGIIALLAVLVVTLLAAVMGGKAGERYHRRVDRAGMDRSDMHRSDMADTRTSDRTAGTRRA